MKVKEQKKQVREERRQEKKQMYENLATDSSFVTTFKSG